MTSEGGSVRSTEGHRVLNAIWEAAVEVIDSDMDLARAVDEFKDALREAADDAAKNRKRQLEKC